MSKDGPESRRNSVKLCHMENCRQLLLCFSAVFHYCVRLSSTQQERCYAIPRAKKLRGLRGVLGVAVRAGFALTWRLVQLLLLLASSASQVGGRHQRHRTGCQPCFYAEQAHDVIIQLREEEYC